MEQAYLIMDTKEGKIVHIFRDKTLAEKYFENICHEADYQLLPTAYADEQFQPMLSHEDYVANDFHFVSMFKREEGHFKPLSSSYPDVDVSYNTYNTFLHPKGHSVLTMIEDFGYGLVFSLNYRVYEEHPLSETEKQKWLETLHPIFEEIQTLYMEKKQSKEEIRSWVNAQLSAKK